jgi:hypothetical protein
MSNRKIDNRGTYIENQTVSGGEVYNAGHDINVHQNKAGLSVQEFQSLLNQIRSEIKALPLSQNDKKDIFANIDTAINQTQKKEPKKSLVVGPLSTAFELLVQAGGAAKAVEAIIPLFNKALAFAQNVF